MNLLNKKPPIKSISRLWRLFFLSLFGLFCFAATSQAKQIDQVNIGIFDNKPMCFFDATGKPAGIFVSVVEYTALQEGWDLTYVKGSFSTLREKLANGEIDILLSTAVSEERQKIYSYNKIDVFSNWAEVYVTPQAKINSLLDLQGKRIATLANGIYSTGPEGIVQLNDKFNLNCSFVFVKDYKDTFASVQAKLADAAVVNRLVGAVYEDEYGLTKSGIVFAPVKIRFALNKGNPATPLLIAALDKHLNELIQDEESVYQQAINEAMGGSGDADTRKIPQYYWLILLAALLFIASLVGLSLFLRWQINRRTKDLRATHDKLSANERKYRRLIDSTATAPWELDLTNGSFSYMGKQIEKVLGYPVESWKDINVWSDRLYDEDRQEAQQFCEIETKKGNDHEFVYRAVHQDGSVRWIRDVVSVIKEAGKAQKLVGFMHDITEQQLLALEKEKLTRHFQQAQKMEAIGTLAGGIAHDFNNILGAILGYTEMARDDSPPDSSVVADLDRVLQAANRAKGLVAQILAFSRHNDVERIPLYPVSLVKEVVKMLRPSLPTTIEIIQDIPSKTSSILADPTQVHQILMNLCTNAFHAMEETGGRLEISLKETELQTEDLKNEPGVEAGQFIQLSIGDSGTGIAPEIKDKIFNPFFTTKEIGKGTGMGLSIAHGIVKSYGGFISVYSELNEGTVFNIFLPVLNSEELLGKEELRAIQIGNERVLFVDDEELLVEMGTDMLQRLGYHVTAKNSSLEALEAFQNQPDQFDLVITDQTMPGMTGSDLARRMIQIRPDIPIILCTGYSTIINEEQAKAVGIKEFALKPLTKRDIARLVRKVLDATV